MYGSPLGKDWRVKKVKNEGAKPLEKFKKDKPVLSTKTGKELVEKSCSPQELLWLDAWLDNLVRSRSLPPQCRGKDAFNALTQFLSAPDVLSVLELLRKDFLASHPQKAEEVDDFQFLLAELGAYPSHQTLPPPSDHNNRRRADDPSSS
jgi:hypothetical protein